MSNAKAREIIARLGLEPHPEGGWFRETWRAGAAPGERAGATAIHFLLEEGQHSHWHKVDAAELWLWHAGHPLALDIAPEAAAPASRGVLGGDVLSGQSPQLLVPPHHWQAAQPLGGWTLVSCVVSPGFEFSGFELAPPDWRPGG
jgi:predicted cupin superfamily sugar epimerase